MEDNDNQPRSLRKCIRPPQRCLRSTCSIVIEDASSNDRIAQLRSGNRLEAAKASRPIAKRDAEPSSSSTKTKSNGLLKATRMGEKDPIPKRPIRRSMAKNLRLVVSTAYRNRQTGDVYSFGEGRRMIVIPIDASLADLKEESEKILNQTVYEVFVKEGDAVVPFHSKHVLHTMDELFAIVDPPPRSRMSVFRSSLFEMANFSQLDHKLLCRNSELHKEASALQKSAAHVALICRSIALSAPVVEEGNVELRTRARKLQSPVAAGGWAKVRGALLKKDRPFFIYPWKKSLKIDALVLLWMTALPLMAGLPISLTSFESDTDLPVEQHKLYMIGGMCMLGLVTGLFLNAWLGFYFYIHMSILSYICVAICVPGLAYLVFRGLTSVFFPFYNSPVCVMLILVVAVFLLSFPHIPRKLKSKKKTFKKDMTNSLIIINFLILVFIVNRLLVTNFGQRDALSLLTLSLLYPVLVTRSTEDCARLAEAFNRKTVCVVEAFFTFVSSVFQMIVFLGIHAKVNPLLVFFLINSTDMFCLFLSGPLAAFLKKKNRQILKHHQQANGGEDDFGWESFIKWVKV